MRWSEFSWSMDDMIFLVRHLEEMKEGLSPFDKDELLVKPKTTRRNPVAPFTNICELEVRVSNRIKKTNGDGDMLLAYYVKDVSIESLARIGRLDFYIVSRNISRALRYISGHKERKVTYDEFCHH